MTVRTRIFVAVAAPALALVLGYSAAVLAVVGGLRLRDLDEALAGHAGALSGYAEHDGGWELDPVPDHVVAPLAGYRVRADGGEVLVEGGLLRGRLWTGRFEVESEDDPHQVEVTVAQDPSPLLAEVRTLVAWLAVVGVGLAGAALLAADRIARDIVASEDFLRLQAAWERQAAFSADASHELRTPLAVVRSQAEVALRQPRSAEQYRETLAHVLAASARMQDLVEGLLVLARSGERLDATAVDLSAVARSAAADARPAAAVALELDLPATAPALGDPRLLRILLDNLLANAVRHTTEGTVRVRIAREAEGWLLEVVDTGEGIPADERERVFDRFHRVDASRSRTAGGAGLGLSIVRAIAQQHGGRVGLESEEGRGTRVWLRLPAPA